MFRVCGAEASPRKRACNDLRSLQGTEAQLERNNEKVAELLQAASSPQTNSADNMDVETQLKFAEDVARMKTQLQNANAERDAAKRALEAAEVDAKVGSGCKT